MITENLSTLKIHLLSQEQYDRELAAGRIDVNALYLTPDKNIDLSIYATSQEVDDAVLDCTAYTDSTMSQMVTSPTVAKVGQVIAVKSVDDKGRPTSWECIDTFDSEYLNSQISAALESKVDKVDGKSLSTNDYTTAEKNKLAGIASGATKTIVDSELSDTSANPVCNSAIKAALTQMSGLIGESSVEDQISVAVANKVDKISGKGLSTNDYTTTEKNKLAGIATGATKVTVDTALSASSTNPVQNKAVNTAIESLKSLVGTTSVSSQIESAVASKVTAVDGKGLSTNDYTTDEKNKLSGIASGAEVNQNAFAKVVIGSTTISADAKSDTLNIVAGSNITLTPDATNDKITIAAKDTVYAHPSYTAKSAGLYKVTVDGTGHVSATAAVAKSDITALGIPAQDTTYSEASTTAAGLMSKSDKEKLNGIASGANKTTVDSALSSTSTNPVQNKVVNSSISSLKTLVGSTAVSTQISNAVAKVHFATDNNGVLIISST